MNITELKEQLISQAIFDDGSKKIIVTSWDEIGIDADQGEDLILSLEYDERISEVWEQGLPCEPVLVAFIEGVAI